MPRIHDLRQSLAARSRISISTHATGLMAEKVVQSVAIRGRGKRLRSGRDCGIRPGELMIGIADVSETFTF